MFETVGAALGSVVVATLVGGAIAAGAGLLRMPSIGLLLIGGIVVGPEVLGWVDVDSLGGLTVLLVEFCVAVLLFEGGMDLERFKNGAGRVVVRLVTAGIAIAWVLGAMLAVGLVGLDLPEALLLASLAIVSGPTVVKPLLRSVKVKQDLHRIIHWESMVADPAGALLALFVFEWIVGASSTGLAAASGFAWRVAVGLFFGWVSGQLIHRLLNRGRLSPAICAVIAPVVVFPLAETLAPHCGVLCMAVAGFVAGRGAPESTRRAKKVLDDLGEVLLPVVFVVLSASIELDAAISLGLGGVLWIAAMVFVVRPVAVVLSTWGQSICQRQRLFIAWLGPKGIVAAFMASLLAASAEGTGLAGARAVEALTYGLIAATALLHGATAGALASLLRLAPTSPNPQGETPMINAAVRSTNMPRVLHPPLLRRTRVLLADDEPDIREPIAEALRDCGYLVVEAWDGNQLMAGMLLTDERGAPITDVVITDVRMPGADGLQAVEELRRRDWGTGVILITAYGDARLAERARHLGATVIPKPLDLDHLIGTVERIAPSVG